jgi:hypothetical protein
MRLAEHGEMAVTFAVGTEASGAHGPRYRNEGNSKKASDCDRISDHGLTFG